MSFFDDLTDYGVDCEQLDCLVIDCKSKEASSVNNEGMESQVKYLLTQMEEQEILDFFCIKKE